MTKTKHEFAIAINGVENVEATKLESNNVKNTQPTCMCFNKEESHFPPIIQEQAQETNPMLYTNGVT